MLVFGDQKIDSIVEKIESLLSIFLKIDRIESLKVDFSKVDEQDSITVDLSLKIDDSDSNMSIFF